MMDDEHKEALFVAVCGALCIGVLVGMIAGVLMASGSPGTGLTYEEEKFRLGCAKARAYYRSGDTCLGPLNLGNAAEIEAFTNQLQWLEAVGGER